MSLTHRPPITLHLGAHRTGSSTLQRLLDSNASRLRSEAGLALWTPVTTRAGAMTGLLGDPGPADAGRVELGRTAMANRAAAKISLRRRALSRGGVKRLLISEEGFLGGLRENLLLARLYPSAGARLTRLSRSVPGIDRICLSIRSPDAWWTSTLAFLMTRGFAPPEDSMIDAILKGRRGWRQVIEDLALALPEAQITVWTHEEFAAQPEASFARLTGLAPTGPAGPPLNPSPGLAALRARLRDEGCTAEIPGVGDSYAPFTPDQRAALRAAHVQDLAWLREGADGLATFATRRPADAATRDRKGMLHVRSRKPDGALGASG